MEYYSNLILNVISIYNWHTSFRIVNVSSIDMRNVINYLLSLRQDKTSEIFRHIDIFYLKQFVYCLISLKRAFKGHSWWWCINITILFLINISSFILKSFWKCFEEHDVSGIFVYVENNYRTFYFHLIIYL